MRINKFSALAAFIASSVLVFVGCGGDSESAESQRPREIRAPIAKMEVEAPPPIEPAPIVASQPTIIEPAGQPEPPVAEPLPTSYGELMKQGKQLASSGDYERALAMFEEARSLKPKRGQPYVEIARVHIERKDLVEARSLAEEAVEVAPNWSTAWNTLGRVELLEGKLDAAVTSFSRATEENEDNSWAWNNLGYTLIQQQKWDEAVVALERATSGDRVTGYMWNNLGMAYEHLDRVVEARGAYEKGVAGGSGLASQHLQRLDDVTSIAKTVEDGDGGVSVE